MNAQERLLQPWSAPVVPLDIPHGDMPGDKVHVTETHIRKASVMFEALRPMIAEAITQSGCGRCVISICGGSGVGKSETASLVSFFLREMGIGSYTLSGDNYPHRIPQDNDAERMRVYRNGGLQGLVGSGVNPAQYRDVLLKLWESERDAEGTVCGEHPWMRAYQQAGQSRLVEYLGSQQEINFEEVSDIVARFKQGAQALYLRRMGRERDALWYEKVDMGDVRVLVIEWTHGNSDHLRGVDIPVLLNSTPAETLAHRRARSRDGSPDAPFITLVLGIEQRMLEAQAHKARVILSKSGEVITYAQYRKTMAEEENK